jgi:hypothetical protein
MQSMDDEWPRSWVGTWVAPDAKTVAVAWCGSGVTVTVSPGPGREPYASAPLLGGGTKPIANLPAQCGVDGQARWYLEVEAGTPDLGPTYHLYATVDGERAADPGTPVERVVLAPAVRMGLYDDYDDDLGVPWAYPLRPFTRPAPP